MVKVQNGTVDYNQGTFLNIKKYSWQPESRGGHQIVKGWCMGLSDAPTHAKK